MQIFTDYRQNLFDDMRAWRHEIHRHPELAFEENRTAGMVHPGHQQQVETRSIGATQRHGARRPKCKSERSRARLYQPSNREALQQHPQILV